MRHGIVYASQMAESKEELEKLRFCFSTIYERDWTEKVLPSFKKTSTGIWALYH
ncbi:hypothetical protein JG688_00013846 [Phytophthora aleatoria]|uniref:Uncharacterized protein n=1 Tax=Phytophthora aleatoria TaxID=2496075 RepID=A0A8J5M3P6_9STRA|nr:hypothetical protein JG688_00013846 [Phytophthora aleatoria]